MIESFGLVIQYSLENDCVLSIV